MIQEAIVKIVDKQDLTYDEAYAVMNEIMSGETSQKRQGGDRRGDRGLRRRHAGPRYKV